MDAYPEAIAAYSQSLQLARTLQDSWAEMESLFELGEVYRRQKKFAEAIVHYRQSLDLVKTLQNRRVELQVLLKLAELYYWQQSYAEAIAAYEQSLQLSRTLQSRPNEGDSLEGLGLASYQIGDYTQAIAYLEQGLQIARELDNTKQIIRLHSGLGDTHFWAQNFEQAEVYYRALLSLSQKEQNLPGEQEALTGLASIAILKQDIVTAIRLNEQALVLTRKLGELAVLSACDTGRGRITGDGVVGLSRALISAGVPSVIVSLWAIPDTSTATLMTEFYRQWQHQPDKAQALRQAMLQTKQRYPDPKNWAAFTLIGEAL